MKTPLSLSALLLMLSACGASHSGRDTHGDGVGGDDATWDPDGQGVPQFIIADYLDLSRIDRVSKFRSSEGHDYSDSVEQCRSMKHYFQPFGSVGQPHDPSWQTLPVFSPVNGSIDRMFAEGNGMGLQLSITPAGDPAFAVVIFHVSPRSDLQVGGTVAAGEQLGTHASDETMSDVAIWVTMSTSSFRLVSYFEAMDEEVFAGYASRGALARSDFVIERAVRDADPLTCEGMMFTSRGHTGDWMELQ